MPKYYVNKNAQDNGDHEVHKEGCSYMPSEENKKYLGEFTNCHDAVEAAKEIAPKVGLAEEVAITEAAKGAIEAAQAIGPDAAAQVQQSLTERMIDLPREHDKTS